MRVLRAAAFASALAAALSGAAQAQEAPPLVSIERQGYAFGFPRVLAEQRLFGIAHGVSLLAAACLNDAVHADAAAEAYTRWYGQQQLLIDDLKSQLAAFYYGPRAEAATWKHVAGALNLRQSLDLAPERLSDACASLPEALSQPRYDLSSLFQLEAALAATALAARIDAQASACAPQAAAQYAEWQAREAEAATAARAQVRHYWKITATPGDADDWLKALAERYAKPSAATCARLGEWLQTPGAGLAQSFAPAPTPEAVETEGEAVMPVARSAPENVAGVPSAGAKAAPEDAPPPNLFDFLMRLFDERPYESAGTR